MSTTKNNSNIIGAVLLAAGASSRLGTPKQLLPYEGRTLLQHNLHIAHISNAHPIVVVLGAHADIIKGEVDSNIAQRVINDNWSEGLASSIRCGTKTVIEISPNIHGLILMVCDQPFVTASILNDLIAVHQNTGKAIITCSYANTFGPPTLFHKSMFPELLQLTGDVGARSILKKHANDVEVILFPKGNLDIDTKWDYEKLQKSTRKS